MYLLQIFQEESAVSSYLLLANTLAGVSFPESDFVEFLGRMSGIWAVAPGIPGHYQGMKRARSRKGLHKAAHLCLP